MTYDDFFREAFGKRSQMDFKPLGYQRALAEDCFGQEAQLWPALLDVPTGMGKTAAVVLAWLWKRGWRAAQRESANNVRAPRRLVYCLPMRVLVEQTRENVQQWLERLGLSNHVQLDVLMGGEQADGWDLYPEQDTILIGTQDMLISRALNRGYGMSRYRWPMHFGLLNNDCLWVFDEIQLMGSGLATTAQLDAFREKLGAGFDRQSRVHCLWMSATLSPTWLETVDFKASHLGEPLRLHDSDKNASDVYSASKPLELAGVFVGDAAGLAKEIVAAHQAGSRTLAVVNTIKRARDLYREVVKETDKRRLQASVFLIHSRFRPPERQTKVRELLAQPSADGTIVISTQVVEAGVDVSARTLFTELAPWASLIQRFGRCNRRGEFGSGNSARVVWVDLPSDVKKHAELRLPYKIEDLTTARELLLRCVEGVGPTALEKLGAKLEFIHTHVIRRKDLVELFDTTPDLAGNDIDIDRYVRDSDSSDVQVFWRELAGDPPTPIVPLPVRDELCSAPIGEFRRFASKLKQGKVFRRNFLEREWEKVQDEVIYPGQVYMVDCGSGGYSAEYGWTGEPLKKDEEPVQSRQPEKADERIEPDDGSEADPYSQISKWQTLAEHSDAICAELQKILDTLQIGTPLRDVLLTAARWHDLGKAHWVFRHALPDGIPDPFVPWAKAPGKWKKYARRHFRHELASALAVLQERDSLISDEHRALTAYLVAAHHGKVRLSIRSMPNETRPNDPEVRFARGVWDGDELPKCELGDGVVAPAVTLSLEPMELGLSRDGEPSWVERMLALRDDPRYGPFRLAYLEALVRAADMRVSIEANRS